MIQTASLSGRPKHPAWPGRSNNPRSHWTTTTKARIDYAKQMDTYSEYSIYATVLKTTDPAKIIALVEPLEQRNPKSESIEKSYGTYLNALRKTGQDDKAGAAAEKEADRDPNNEDVLLIAADYNMQRQNQDKALVYATKLSEVMQGKSQTGGIG